VVIDAVKKAEDTDALVVRLYDAWGQRGPVRLTCTAPVGQAHRADLLERRGEQLELAADGSVPFTVRPFEIVTLLLEPA
jgi:alpha-mannosidase